MELPEHLTVENTYEAGLNVHIWLDGVEQRHVFEAHTSEGWIIRAKLDERGHIYADGENVATERVNGLVTVGLSS